MARPFTPLAPSVIRKAADFIEFWHAVQNSLQTLPAEKLALLQDTLDRQDREFFGPMLLAQHAGLYLGAASAVMEERKLGRKRKHEARLKAQEKRAAERQAAMALIELMAA